MVQDADTRQHEDSLTIIWGISVVCSGVGGDEILYLYKATVHTKTIKKIKLQSFYLGTSMFSVSTAVFLSY